MSGLTVFIIYVVGVIALAYRRASLKTAAIASSLLFIIYLIFIDNFTHMPGILMASYVALATRQAVRKPFWDTPLASLCIS